MRSMQWHLGILGTISSFAASSSLYCIILCLSYIHSSVNQILQMQITNGVFVHVKFFLRACWGVEVQRHSFLAFAMHGVSGRLNTSGALPQGKICRYAFGRRVGGIQSRCDRFEEEEYHSLLPGIELQFLSRPACRVSTTNTKVHLCIRNTTFIIIYSI